MPEFTNLRDANRDEDNLAHATDFHFPATNVVSYTFQTLIYILQKYPHPGPVKTANQLAGSRMQ
jgi:hypothetical protein